MPSPVLKLIAPARSLRCLNPLQLGKDYLGWLVPVSWVVLQLPITCLIPVGVGFLVATSPLYAKGTKVSPASDGTGAIAQIPSVPEDVPSFPENAPPVLEELPRIPPVPESEPESEPLPPLPSPEELLGPETSPTSPGTAPSQTESLTVGISGYEILGSTVFSEAQLAEVTAPFTGDNLTFNDILAARSAVTELYVEAGYITSGAIVPPQEFQAGERVQIQVIEGQLEAIEVRGTRRLNPGYVSSRLGVRSMPPLNRDSLLEALQLLQIDPLIETISADLQAGTRPGTNLLVVTITEAESFDADYALDNNRSPSVGTFRNQFLLAENNLLGWGDRLSASYRTTTGSNEYSFGYRLPINPDNGTLQFVGTFTNSDVIEEPFDVLDIFSNSNSYEITLRQPLIQTPRNELVLGLTGTHQNSQSFLGINDIGPFPLTEGADENGRLRVSALRFFQEWSQRDNQQVIALRSQFNLGLNLFDATINDSGPDGRFFSWQGQAQWVRLLAPDMLLLLRGGIQLSTDELLSLERFGLGGQSTVRGYRQDQLLTDNAVLGSVEVRIPVYRDRQDDLLVQVVPFVDVGHGWNVNRADPDPSTLLGVGTGLRLTLADDVTAQLDVGFPLISTNTDEDTLQESGVYFSVGFSLF